MIDVMLDIETLGTTPDAVILSIAAVRFDPLIQDKFYDPPLNIHVDIDSQDRVIDQSTLDWWANQSEEAQDKVFNPDQDRLPLDSALDQLTKFVWQADRIWANGVHFDIPILENAYRQYEKPYPWRYYKIMDTRTLFKVVKGFDRITKQNTHDALEDCVLQAKNLQQVLQLIGTESIS